jgi:hypothetical protein
MGVPQKASVKEKTFNVRQNSLRKCIHDDSFHPGYHLGIRQRLILQLLRSPGGGVHDAQWRSSHLCRELPGTIYDRISTPHDSLIAPQSARVTKTIRSRCRRIFDAESK